MTPDIDETIRCTVSSCSCVCFKPGNAQLRSCDRCGHGWVAHALEKFQAQPPSTCGPVEVALPGLVFDLSSLILYGAQAIPVRLKILLDRLYSVLTPEQVSHILHTLGWSLGDYVRGYMLQYPSGKVLDCWLMVTQEEELLILKQFLRFGETRPIVELMTLQCFATDSRFSDLKLNPVPKSCQPNISTFIERNRKTSGVFRNTRGDSCFVAGICHLEKNRPADHATVEHLENFPGRLSLLLPVTFASDEAHCVAPSTKPTQYLQKPSGTKQTEHQMQNGGRRGQENDPILPQSNVELALKIKVDPDKSNPAQSPLQQSHQFYYHQEHVLHKGVTKTEKASPLSPSLNSSLIPCSSSLYSPISSSTSSPLKGSHGLQDSSTPSSHPLPSFSSSFLCPPPISPFSSSLHPLPSSLCSLPAAGRKGRVCCGVCGKSFYDKGTLKIHYNAVHLKIKHRCTVAGCTMVFSSLRSRNRHSANPNPRLHTSSNRDTQIHRNSGTHIHEAKQARKHIHNTHARMCRGKKVCNTRWQQDDDAHTLRHKSDTPSQDGSPPSPHPLQQTLSQDTHPNYTPNNSIYRLNLHPQAALPPLLLPAHCASSLGSPSSFVPLVVPVAEKPKNCHPLLSHIAPALLSDSTSISLANCNNQSVSCEYGVTEGKQGDICTSPVTYQQQRWESGEPMPKKKPRKSSMPVKIERENLERRRNMEEGEC